VDGRHIGVVLMDDHQIIREGFRALLERQDDLEVLAEASTVAEAVALDVEADVIVADLVLGDERGAGVVHRLKAAHPRSAILVLTMVDSLTDLSLCLAAGARGYLLKEAASSELVEAVRHVAAGEEYIQPSLRAALARWREVPSRARGAAIHELTRREREVLRFVALGHTNPEIAEMLSISVRTVENHRANITRRLGVQTRAALVRHASKLGLI